MSSLCPHHPDGCDGCDCLIAVAVVAASVVMVPLVVALAPLLLPVAFVQNVLSLRSVHRARVGDVLVSRNGRAQAHILSGPRTAYPRVALIKWIPQMLPQIVEYDNARNLLDHLVVTAFHTPLSIGAHLGLVELVQHVASEPWHGDVFDSCARAVNGATRAHLLWTLQRPVRLVQRAWRAHAQARLRWAVGVVEGSVLNSLYRPGGEHYHEVARRWLAFTKDEEAGTEDGMADEEGRPLRIVEAELLLHSAK